MPDAQQLAITSPHPEKQIGEREICQDLPVRDQLLQVCGGIGPDVALLGEQVGERGHDRASLGAFAGVGSPLVTQATIRPARTDDLAAIGRLTVTAYLDEQLAPQEYAATLADVAHRARHTEILVAVDEQDAPLGAVALVLGGGPYAELAVAEDEAEFRMLAVSAHARGKGVGTALIQECLTRARAAGKRRMVISTGARMGAAHRRYEALGFHRAPELDWSPLPGERLLGYVLNLGPAPARRG